MIKDTIQLLNEKIQVFAEKTQLKDIRFEEDKKRAVWAVRYAITKVEFVFQKKQSLDCPVASLFVRIYLGKNEQVFYHIAELLEYLSADDFQAHYYSYMESAERVEHCFVRIEEFLLRHLPKIHEIAKNTTLCTEIKEKKMDEMTRLFTGTRVEKSMEGAACREYETVLLLRYTGEGPYRDIVCGDVARAIKHYEKLEAKDRITNYEKRILRELKNGEIPVLINEECNTVKVFYKNYSDRAQGKAILLAALKMEAVLGILFSLMIGGIYMYCSGDCLYYAGMQWYDGFLLAGLPALFGGIAFRRGIRRKQDALEELVTPRWVEKFAHCSFGITLVLMFFLTFSVSMMHSRFYEEKLIFNDGEKLFPIIFETCQYEDIKAVYYAKGVRNDFGEFVARPSYLILFEDGTLWDSDGCMEMEAAKTYVLEIIDDFYDEILTVEEKNVLWENTKMKN